MLHVSWYFQSIPVALNAQTLGSEKFLPLNTGENSFEICLDGLSGFSNIETSCSQRSPVCLSP